MLLLNGLLRPNSQTLAAIGRTPVGVGDVTLHHFKRIKDPRGELCVGEFMKEIPFSPKRYFFIFNVPEGKKRGEHAHFECQQFLICVKGSCNLIVDDGKSRAEINLDSPEKGVYIPPYIWGTLYQYSSMQFYWSLHPTIMKQLITYMIIRIL